MTTDFTPIFLFLIIAVGTGLSMLVMSAFLGPRKSTQIKQMPYESGMDPIGDARQRFDVRYLPGRDRVPAVRRRVAVFCTPGPSRQWSADAAIPARRPGGPADRRHAAGSSGWLVFWEILVFMASWPRASHTLEEGSLRMAVGLTAAASPAGADVCRRHQSDRDRRPSASKSPENAIVTTLDSVVNWCRKYSLWPMPFATACCGIELMAVGASRFDIARFGAEVMRFSPRQCDLMIVAGRVAMKMMPVLQRIWLQMPEPKWCISMGACASTGGIFDTYAVVQGVDRFIPVDVYIPGCPPRPEQILRALDGHPGEDPEGAARSSARGPARAWPSARRCWPRSGTSRPGSAPPPSAATRTGSATASPAAPSSLGRRRDAMNPRATTTIARLIRSILRGARAR